VEWEDGACRSFIRRLAAFATVVRFDKRGTGLSDPVQELPTLEERDADLAAVIADAGVDRPVHPRDVIFLDALPRTATGKVQKTVLRDLVTRPIPSQVG
jgi:acyl-coenzyme A synthetase/AMP-(fatty) acid ligase